MGNVYFLPHVAEDNLWVKNDKTADLDTISIQFFYIHMYYAYGGGYSRGGGGVGGGGGASVPPTPLNEILIIIILGNL